jgi:carbamoyltransferase
VNILGINVFHADVSAVLVRDGELVAALEEERFRRIKHYAGFPELAIRQCLEIGGIVGGDVNAIAVSRNPHANVLRKMTYVLGRRPGT